MLIKDNANISNMIYGIKLDTIKFWVVSGIGVLLFLMRISSVLVTFSEILKRIRIHSKLTLRGVGTS